MWAGSPRRWDSKAHYHSRRAGGSSPAPLATTRHGERFAKGHDLQELNQAFWADCRASAEAEASGRGPLGFQWIHRLGDQGGCGQHSQPCQYCRGGY